MRRPPLDAEGPRIAPRPRGTALASPLALGLAAAVGIALMIWAIHAAAEPVRRMDREHRALQALEARTIPQLQVVGAVSLRPYEGSPQWLAEGEIRNGSDHPTTQIHLAGVFRNAEGQEIGRGETVVPPVLALPSGESVAFQILCERRGKPAKCEVRVLEALPLPRPSQLAGGG